MYNVIVYIIFVVVAIYVVFLRISFLFSKVFDIAISKTSNAIFLKRGFVWADLSLYENGLAWKASTVVSSTSEWLSCLLGCLRLFYRSSLFILSRIVDFCFLIRSFYFTALCHFHGILLSRWICRPTYSFVILNSENKLINKIIYIHFGWTSNKFTGVGFEPATSKSIHQWSHSRLHVFTLTITGT